MEVILLDCNCLLIVELFLNDKEGPKSLTLKPEVGVMDTLDVAGLTKTLNSALSQIYSTKKPERKVSLDLLLSTPS